MMGAPRIAIVFAAALALAVPSACRPADRASDDRRTNGTVIVGVDGLEWDVVLPLLRGGRMPHLEALMRRGRFGTLDTQAPAKSPVIWTTIATGKPPADHGIVDFTFEDDAGRTALYASGDRRTKALWNIFTDAGKRVAIVGWWNTFPAEPVGGVIVSQANTLEQVARRRLLKPGGMLRGVEGQVWPPERQDEMWSIVEDVDREMPALLRRIFGEGVRPLSEAERANLDACAWSVRADESNRRIAARLLAERPLPDLFAVYFGTPDVVSHRFWRFREPEAFEHPPSAEEVRRFGRIIDDAYAHADSVIGEIVAAAGSGADVFVVSDHGAHPHNTSSRFDVAVNSRLERESGGHEDGPPGLIVAAGPSIPASSQGAPLRDLTRADIPRVGAVADVAPTILALHGIPIGRDMPGSVLDSLVEASDLTVEYVATHDTPEWQATRGARPAEFPGTQERLEQLRALGYIDGGSGEGSDPDATPGGD